MPNKTKDEKQELLYKAQFYQQNFQELVKQLTVVEQGKRELEASIETIKELPNEKSNETLVPISPWVSVQATMEKKDEFIVNVGADIMVKKTAAETIEYLEKQKSKLEENEELLKAHIQRVQSSLISIEKELQSTLKE